MLGENNKKVLTVIGLAQACWSVQKRLRVVHPFQFILNYYIPSCLQNFKSLLVDELSKHFPKEIDEYQKIKERQLKTWM